MKYNEENRAFASFSGECPYKCAHCYTFSSEFVNKGRETIEDILNSIEDKTFKIVYVSGYKENFAESLEGIKLLEAIYERYLCDILITTRAVFDDESINRLVSLNKSMKENGNKLYVCVSIPAYDSYKLLEPNSKIPTPQQRISFMKKLHSRKIYSILTIRPLCPSEFIPVKEAIKIIDELSTYCTAVISSGIVVDDYILKKLPTFPKKFNYNEKQLMNCLANDMIVKYVDVEKELKLIQEHCNFLEIPFFTNSLPAINYIDKEL